MHNDFMNSSPTTPPTNSPVRTLGSVVVKPMTEIISKALPNLRTLTNQTVVLVVGVSKSGKSTLINYLLGCKFYEKRGPGGRKIAELGAEETLHAPMSSSLDSFTLAPCAYEKDGIVYCDTPGFVDNRGREERICAIGCTQAGMSLLKAIQTLVVVIDVTALYSDANASYLKTLAHHLSQIIKIEKFPFNMVFALTKPDDHTLGDIMDMIKIHINYLSDQLQIVSDRIVELEDDKASYQHIEERKKEANSICHSLFLLSRMNEKNSFIINVFDNGESRLCFESALKAEQALPGITKEQFNFGAVSMEWQKFENFIREMAQPATQKITRRMQLPGLLYEKETENKTIALRLEFLESRIVALRKGQPESLAALKELRVENERHILGYEQQLKILQNLNETAKEKIRSIENAAPKSYKSLTWKAEDATMRTGQLAIWIAVGLGMMGVAWLAGASLIKTAAEAAAKAGEAATKATAQATAAATAKATAEAAAKTAQTAAITAAKAAAEATAKATASATAAETAKAAAKAATETAVQAGTKATAAVVETASKIVAGVALNGTTDPAVVVGAVVEIAKTATEISAKSAAEAAAKAATEAAARAAADATVKAAAEATAKSAAETAARAAAETAARAASTAATAIAAKTAAEAATKEAAEAALKLTTTTAAATSVTTVTTGTGATGTSAALFNFLYRNECSLKYADIPYDNVKVEYQYGILKRDESKCDPTKGQYSATFKGQNSDAKVAVEFYVLPKNLPDNMSLLNSFQEEIALNFKEIGDLESKISLLKKNNAKTSEIEMLEAEKVERIATQTQLNIEIPALTQELQIIKQEIQDNANLYEVLTQIAPLFSTVFIQQFLAVYTRYNQLTPQQREDGLFLAMQKFYLNPETVDWSSQAQRLGRSNAVEVYKRLHKETGNWVAVKQMFIEQLTPEVLHEAQLMARFKHPNIVNFYGITQTQGPVVSYALVMECMACSLCDILHNNSILDDQLPVAWRMQVVSQIVSAIIYLHETSVLHRDIKSPNILLSEDRKMVKLTDFGISKFVTATTQTVAGTPFWLAPEMGETGATKATDIFALGIVIAEIVNRKFPFEGRILSADQYREKIQAGLLVFSDKFPVLSALGRDCIQIAPDERPTAQQCQTRL